MRDDVAVPDNLIKLPNEAIAYRTSSNTRRSRQHRWHRQHPAARITAVAAWSTRLFSAGLTMLGLQRQGAPCFLLPHNRREDLMSDSVYKVIELIGTSKDSWEKAAASAVTRASKTLRDLRVAEVVKLDMQLDETGAIEVYRVKLNVSFKFEGT
jgi:dodecin